MSATTTPRFVSSLPTAFWAHLIEGNRLLRGDSHKKIKPDFERAIVEYQLAYEQHPDPIALLNEAGAHRALGHNDEALRLYERFITEEPGGSQHRDEALMVARNWIANLTYVAPASLPTRRSVPIPPPIAPSLPSLFDWMVNGPANDAFDDTPICPSQRSQRISAEQLGKLLPFLAMEAN